MSEIRDRRLTDVVGQIQALDQVADLSEEDLGRLGDSLAAQLRDWQTLLRAAPVQGRQILRKLLVGRLTMTPRTEGAERFYEYAGEATLGRLVAGALGGARAVVAPTGFEPVFQP